MEKWGRESIKCEINLEDRISLLRGESEKLSCNFTRTVFHRNFKMQNYVHENTKSLEQLSQLCRQKQRFLERQAYKWSRNILFLLSSNGALSGNSPPRDENDIQSGLLRCVGVDDIMLVRTESMRSCGSVSKVFWIEVSFILCLFSWLVRFLVILKTFFSSSSGRDDEDKKN